MTEHHRFEGKVAIVTGGGTGIGRTTTKLLLDEGASVAIVGRRADVLDAAAAELGDRVLVVTGDIGVSGEAARIVAATVDHFGGLDVLVNNAAVWLPRFVDELTDEEISSTLMINQFGIITMVREALPHLVASGGCIVNMSSTGARFPFAANSLYAGTKAAVEQMTRTLAVELGPKGVRVNTVAAGATDTEMINVFMDETAVAQTIAMTPLGRVGRPEDVSRAVVFMASDDARWVTGQILQASGGLSL